MAYMPELHYCRVCGEYLGPENGDGICLACDELNKLVEASFGTVSYPAWEARLGNGKAARLVAVAGALRAGEEIGGLSMRVIIAGSRSIASKAVVAEAMEEAAQQGILPSCVLSGCASGVDVIGAAWADERDIPKELYPADWRTFGKAAGPIRNGEMVAIADALVAIHDGTSRGTADVIRKARAAGLKVFVKIVPGEA